MITENLSYNPVILERFVKIIDKKRLAHAYLLVGPKYAGKSETALAIAKLVNCEGTKDDRGIFCDQCPDCLKINARSHPDVHIIEGEEGGSIKIEQVRGLLEQAKLRPFSAVKKVFIVINVEDLTMEGANALLKTLEEPSASSLILLTTSVPEKNLGTIRSRCHAIPFPVPANDQLAAIMERDYGEKAPSAHVLGFFAEGCLGTAKRLQENGFYKRKNEMIDEFVLSDCDESYVKGLLADKAKTEEFLNVLLSWVHDTLLLKAGVDDERVIHIDRIKELKKFTSRHGFEELGGLYHEIVKAQKMLADNLNVKMPLLIIKEKFHE